MSPGWTQGLTEARFVIHRAPEMQPILPFFPQALLSPDQQAPFPWEGGLVRASASWCDLGPQNEALALQPHFNVVSSRCCGLMLCLELSHVLIPALILCDR